LKSDMDHRRLPRIKRTSTLSCHSDLNVSLENAFGKQLRSARIAFTDEVLTFRRESMRGILMSIGSFSSLMKNLKIRLFGILTPIKQQNRKIRFPIPELCWN
jgi:hypothetical protein